MDFAIFDIRTISLLIASVMGFIGALIIFTGGIHGLYLFLKKATGAQILLADIRIELGHYMALGLEFLVGKDIIETLAEPTWNMLGKLAVLIALRTALTMFLAHEVKDVREELEQEQAIVSLKKNMIRKTNE